MGGRRQGKERTTKTFLKWVGGWVGGFVLQVYIRFFFPPFTTVYCFLVKEEGTLPSTSPPPLASTNQSSHPPTHPPSISTTRSPGRPRWS